MFKLVHIDLSGLIKGHGKSKSLQIYTWNEDWGFKRFIRRQDFSLKLFYFCLNSKLFKFVQSPYLFKSRKICQIVKHQVLLQKHFLLSLPIHISLIYVMSRLVCQQQSISILKSMQCLSFCPFFKPPSHEPI